MSYLSSANRDLPIYGIWAIRYSALKTTMKTKAKTNTRLTLWPSAVVGNASCPFLNKTLAMCLKMIHDDTHDTRMKTKMFVLLCLHSFH